MKFDSYGNWVKFFALNYQEDGPVSIEDDCIDDILKQASSVINHENTHYVVLKKYVDGKEECFLRADQKDTRWTIDFFDYRLAEETGIANVSKFQTHQYWCGLDQMPEKLQEVITINEL